MYGDSRLECSGSLERWRDYLEFADSPRYRTGTVERSGKILFTGRKLTWGDQRSIVFPIRPAGQEDPPRDALTLSREHTLMRLVVVCFEAVRPLNIPICTAASAWMTTTSRYSYLNSPSARRSHGQDPTSSNTTGLDWPALGRNSRWNPTSTSASDCGTRKSPLKHSGPLSSQEG